MFGIRLGDELMYGLLDKIRGLIRPQISRIFVDFFEVGGGKWLMVILDNECGFFSPADFADFRRFF